MNLDFKVIYGKVLKPGDRVSIASFKRGQINIEASIPLELPGEKENVDESASEWGGGSGKYWTTQVDYNPELDEKIRKACSFSALHCAKLIPLYEVSNHHDSEPLASREWTVALEYPNPES